MFKLQEKDLHEIMALMRTLGPDPKEPRLKLAQFQIAYLYSYPPPVGTGRIHSRQASC